MAFHLRSVFLRLLLLCVTLNLSDAPYWDEWMAETLQDPAQAVQVTIDATALQASKEEMAEQSTVKRSIYEMLLALVAMPMQDTPGQPGAELVHGLPGLVEPLLKSAPPSPLERPPRFVAVV